jgi:hypothetical protein
VLEGNRFVAFFDLLGFSSWLETEGSLEVFTYVRGFLNLMIRASLPGSVVHEDMSVTVETPDIGFINFSDSIVFYSRDDSEQCFQLMLRVCGEFMNGMICGPSRMVRGAISHGEFYADPEANAYVGKALVDAYRLEGAQDWLAFSFHDSITKLPLFKRALANHPRLIVPPTVSLRNSDAMPYCLNWADEEFFVGISFNARRGLADCCKRGRKSLRGNSTEMGKLRRRIKHTSDFLKKNGVTKKPRK